MFSSSLRSNWIRSRLAKRGRSFLSAEKLKIQKSKQQSTMDISGALSDKSRDPTPPHPSLLLISLPLLPSLSSLTQNKESLIVENYFPSRREPQNPFSLPVIIFLLFGLLPRTVSFTQHYTLKLHSVVHSLTNEGGSTHLSSSQTNYLKS